MISQRAVVAVVVHKSFELVFGISPIGNQKEEFNKYWEIARMGKPPELEIRALFYRLNKQKEPGEEERSKHLRMFGLIYVEINFN